MQRNMIPTATTLHFISYLCSIRHAICRLFIYYTMEKEIKTPSLAHRNFMRINLLGSLLIVAFDVALTVYGWGCDRIRWGYLVIYSLIICLSYFLGGVIAWKSFTEKHWRSMVGRQLFVGNALVLVFCLTVTGFSVSMLCITFILTYFVLGGLFSALVLSLCYFVFRKSYNDRN